MHDDHDHDHDDPANPWADRVNEAYYDGMGAAFGQRTRERINWMCAQARGDTVLDVGCSQGIASILMAREGMTVTGLDIFEPAIAYASKERAKEIESVRNRLTFRCAELSALKDVAFDTVVMGEVVEHQTNPIRFIQSGAALAGDGGRVIVTVPYGLHPWPDHKSTIFPSDIQAALEDAFTIELLEVQDGYVRAVADRKSGSSRAKTDHSALAKITEQGALDAQKRYYEANARAGALEAGKRDLERKLAEWQGKHAALEARRHELEQQVALRTQAQAEADQRAGDVRAQIEEHKRNAQEFGAMRERYLERIELLVQESATHRAVSEQAGRTILSLEASRQDGVSRLQKAQDAAEALRREADAAAAKARQEFDAASARWQKDGDALKAQVEQLRQDGVRLQDEIGRLQREGASAQAEIERLRREHAAARDENGGLRLRSGDLDAENAALKDAGRELQARLDGMQSELAVAQQKRSGHYAHLVAERERTEQLIALLRELHDDNQRYRHSIALALGRAGLGLTSPRGILGFPRAMLNVARMYRARRNGGPALEPLVLPKLKPAALPAPQTGGAPTNGARTDAAAATPAENEKTLSVLGWRQDANPALMPVMSVLDEFSRSCFAPQAALIEPRPDNWEGLLELCQPKFLFVESSWKGNYGAWQYRVSGYAHPPGQELGEMVAGFRARGIPTVFWNKEDPVHFTNFIDNAAKFDVVLTTASEAIPMYRERTHAEVGTLQFAAEESLHNPIGSAHRNGKVCFAGSFYANRFEERRNDQLMLLDAATSHDFDIYDRNYSADRSKKSDFAFPDRFDPFVRGRLPYAAIGRAYREYRVFLNVNSVIDSPTMFSRRVFELLACGTPIVSTWAKGTEETFGDDLVWHVRDREEAEHAIQVLMTDDREWRRRSLAGIRAVLSAHTYRHRFEQICAMLALDDRREDRFRNVLVVAEATNRQEAAAVVDAFRRQTMLPGVDKRLLLAAPVGLDIDADDARIDVVSAADRNLADLLEDSRWTNGQGMVATLSPAAVYGGHYLQDLLLAARYSGAAIVGKPSEAPDANQYAFDVPVDARSLLVNVGALQLSGARLGNVLRHDLSAVPAGGKHVYASDSANFHPLGDDRPGGTDVGEILSKIEF